MSANEALQKMVVVQDFGKADILTGQQKDVAETKAFIANQTKEHKASICTPSVQFMHFSAEPE